MCIFYQYRYGLEGVINLLGLLGVGLNFVLEIHEFVRLRPISVRTYFPVEVAPGIFGEKSFFQPPIQSIGSEGSHRAANPVFFYSPDFCTLLRPWRLVSSQSFWILRLAATSLRYQSLPPPSCHNSSKALTFCSVSPIARLLR